jgi:hypothetical protein
MRARGMPSLDPLRVGRARLRHRYSSNCAGILAKLPHFGLTTYFDIGANMGLLSICNEARCKRLLDRGFAICFAGSTPNPFSRDLPAELDRNR